jgi:hypothetical protein
VALWHFNEGVNTTVFDETENDNDGTIYGATWTGTPPTWVAGKYGYALQSDGIDDYVLVPDSDSLDVTNEITIEAWIKMGNNDNGDGIMFKDYAYGVHCWNWRPDTEINPCVFIDTQWAGSNWVPDVTINYWKWHHIVFTFDGTYQRFYVDGTLVDEKYWPGQISVSQHDLTIGLRRILRDQKFHQDYFTGVIDEVRI